MLSDFEIPVKSEVEYLNYYLKYSVLKNKSADVSIIFERLQKSELCYTQNLVKNYWLRLRRDFLPDINKNLNILARSCLYFSIWFLINA
jgi:hypothetical protein